MELKYRKCTNLFSERCQDWIKKRFGEFKKDNPVAIPHDYLKSNEICTNCNDFSLKDIPAEE